MRSLVYAGLVLLGPSIFSAYAADQPLVVVEDNGGVSALPYYRALNLQPRVSQSDYTSPPLEFPAPPAKPRSEADMLPVRSMMLTPGVVERRVIQAPGLRPLFLVGDDERSRTWLRQRLDILRELGAVGLVVDVESLVVLDELRRLAPGLILSPVSADDLARRLGIRHYPVLITATGIEQ
jgi:integrating conjugative element protein (TIGR03765 family)